MKKIKKLTFAEMNDASTLLTRQEMRQIMAGSGGEECNCLFCYDSSGVQTISTSCWGDPTLTCYANTGIWPNNASWGVC